MLWNSDISGAFSGIQGARSGIQSHCSVIRQPCVYQVVAGACFVMFLRLRSTRG